MKIKVEPFIERDIEPLAIPTEKTKDVELILGNPLKTVKIGSGLGEHLRTGLVDLIRIYVDIFTCVLSDMPSIHKSVAVNYLSVDHALKPIRQKRRIFAQNDKRLLMMK